jgi:hypothetical protein
MSCTVCNHARRRDIDLALLDHTATLAQLSARYRLSQSALHRHKQHLLKKMARIENRFQNILREGSVFILNSLLHLIMPIAHKAGVEGNSRQVLQAARQGTAIIKLMHKLDFALDEDTVYRLLELPESADLDGLLPPDLKIYADSRQTLADSLFASCPSEQEQALDSDAAADLADLSPELLQNLITDLSQSLDLAGFAPPAAGREKSGKKAKNSVHMKNNYKKYQPDNLAAKNIAKSPSAAKPAPLISDFQPAYSDILGQSHPAGAPADQKSPQKQRSWIQDLDEGRLDIDALNAIGAGRPYAESTNYAAAALEP